MMCRKILLGLNGGAHEEEEELGSNGFIDYVIPEIYIIRNIYKVSYFFLKYNIVI